MFKRIIPILLVLIALAACTGPGQATRYSNQPYQAQQVAYPTQYAQPAYPAQQPVQQMPAQYDYAKMPGKKITETVTKGLPEPEIRNTGSMTIITQYDDSGDTIWVITIFRDSEGHIVRTTRVDTSYGNRTTYVNQNGETIVDQRITGATYREDSDGDGDLDIIKIYEYENGQLRRTTTYTKNAQGTWDYETVTGTAGPVVASGTVQQVPGQ